MKFKKLAVITDCIHMYDKKGGVATENHIFRKQLQAMAGLFEETLICCPFTIYDEDKVISVYDNSSIKFLPLPNVGGRKLSDKLKLITTVPTWIRAFKKANHFADIVYQRFPNNLNIPGAFYFYLKQKKVFATYTGTWKNYDGEPFTYRFQKWVLKKIFRGPVFIYAADTTANKKFVKSFSPSFTLNEWADEEHYVEEKIKKIETVKLNIPTFITVGSLQKNKNQQYILDAFKRLSNQHFLFRLFIVGDGPLKESYESFIAANDLQEKVFLMGKKTSDQLKGLYRQSDFLIQSPFAEGFGKVPVEGFCHGVVPMLSNTAFAGEMIGSNERGFLFPLNNVNALAELIKSTVSNQSLLPGIIKNGRMFAKTYTLDSWVKNFDEVLKNCNEDSGL